MKTIHIHEAKTHLSRYVEEAAAGEEIIIAKAGKPLARLVPLAPRKQLRQLGLGRGRFEIPEAFDTLYADEIRPGDVQNDLRDPACEVLFSAASIWEVAIKASLGRGDFAFQPDDVYQLAIDSGFTELPIVAAHAAAVARLPWHHHDPFDRLLVAQAQTLPAYLLTSDSFLTRYSNLVRWVTLTRP